MHDSIKNPLPTPNGWMVAKNKHTHTHTHTHFKLETYVTLSVKIQLK